MSLSNHLSHSGMKVAKFPGEPEEKWTYLGKVEVEPGNHLRFQDVVWRPSQPEFAVYPQLTEEVLGHVVVNPLQLRVVTKTSRANINSDHRWFIDALSIEQVWCDEGLCQP